MEKIRKSYLEALIDTHELLLTTAGQFMRYVCPTQILKSPRFATSIFPLDSNPDFPRQTVKMAGCTTSYSYPTIMCFLTWLYFTAAHRLAPTRFNAPFGSPKRQIKVFLPFQSAGSLYIPRLHERASRDQYLEHAGVAINIHGQSRHTPRSEVEQWKDNHV